MPSLQRMSPLSVLLWRPCSRGAGPHGRTTLTIYLSKVALQMRILKDRDHGPLDDLHRWVEGEHDITLNWGPDFTARFTAEEAATLWSRFKGMDAALQSDVDVFEPAFQARPMRYLFQRTAGRHRHRVVHCRLEQLVLHIPRNAGRAWTILCPLELPR